MQLQQSTGEPDKDDGLFHTTQRMDTPSRMGTPSPQVATLDDFPSVASYDLLGTKCGFTFSVPGEVHWYVIAVWEMPSNSNLPALKSIQTLQNNVLRIMNRSNWQDHTSNNKLFQHFRILKVTDVYKFELSKFM